MHPPRAATFDLDDTLAEIYKPPTPEMAERFTRLLARIPVAIITGSAFDRIARDFLPTLSDRADLAHLSLFPNSSAQCYMYRNNEWQEVYRLTISPEERARITRIIRQATQDLPEFRELIPHGETVFDREVQVTFEATGSDSSRERQVQWDPDRSKRSRMCERLNELLPEYDAHVGGASSIDITTKGVNKAYGVEWFARHLHIPPHEMIFVGDGLTPTGNDTPVIATGIRTIAITCPDDTARVIDDLLLEMNIA